MSDLTILINDASQLLRGVSERFRPSIVERISSALGIDRPTADEDASFLALLAITLSPESAIHYDIKDPRPRWTYVRDYISGFAGLDAASCETLSRRIAGILDDLGHGRKNVGHLEAILARQMGRCKICNLVIRGESRAVSSKDPLRPIWLAPEELTAPELDHVVPIAWTGRNTMDNLQVLCRACNSAKADGVRVSMHREAEMGRRPISHVPRIHLFRLFVWLAQENQGRCDACGSDENEMTMRLTRPAASLVRANLKLICYECLGGRPG